jgi:hypothetical protein
MPRLLEQLSFDKIRSGTLEAEMFQRYSIDPVFRSEINFGTIQLVFFFLARKMVELCLQDTCVFCKYGTSVWQSSEDKNLVNRFLTPLGLQFDDLNTPHPVEFSDGEQADATSLLHLGLIFGWEAIIYGKGAAFRLNHDDYILVKSNAAHPILKDMRFPDSSLTAAEAERFEGLWRL